MQPRIFLIEDDAVIQKVMGIRLRRLGCYVEVASKARDAIARYHNEFHLIFLDLGLPDMSGLEICKHIRHQDLRRDIPIIATTTWHDLKEPCLAAGVDDFALKPVARQTLQRLLYKWLPARLRDKVLFSQEY